MQKWYRIPEVLRAILFGGLAMLAQYLPWTIGVPLGLLFVLGAAWQLWKLNHPKQQHLLIRLPLKRIVALIFILFASIAIVFVVFGSLNIIRTYLQESTPTTTPTQSLQLSHPSPQEIFDYIDNLYPYQQEEARKDYEGRLVTWAVRFISIEPAFGGGYQVQSSSIIEEALFSPSVFFTIDINDYIEFKTMEKGQEFIVQGTIALVGDNWVVLSDCYPFFD
jgi:hypothetical protein